MTALPEIRSPTIDAIEAAVSAGEKREQDGVVRLSGIGKCERNIFYRFRWAHDPEVFEPRIIRLFDTGNVEEGRMIAWLRAAGVTVEAVDPATNEQWEVECAGGHAKGHFDGIATGIIEAPKATHLLECKTHNAKSFAQVVKHGVAVSKPEHHDQMQIYMHLRGLTRAYYLAKNKDNDELHGERVETDPAHGARLVAKAERIVGAHVAPARVAETADSFLCRGCVSAPVCHHGAWAPRNCRTCLHSSPVPSGVWRCEKHGRDLDWAAQEAGCADHLYLPTLVPGEQIDASDGAVTYRLADGRTWIDGELFREGQ